MEPLIFSTRTCALSNLTATENDSRGAGGVIYSESSVLDINMGYFENNWTSSTGGAVSTVHTPYPVSGGPYFTYLTFNNVTAKNNKSTASDGGAFYIASAQDPRAIITFKDILLSGNEGNNGGGAHLTSILDGVMENVYIENNIARVSGGGLYTTGSGGNPLITYKNLTVRNNKAVNYGGGIYNTSMSFILQDFCIKNNCAGYDRRRIPLYHFVGNAINQCGDHRKLC